MAGCCTVGGTWLWIRFLSSSCGQHSTTHTYNCTVAPNVALIICWALRTTTTTTLTSWNSFWHWFLRYVRERTNERKREKRSSTADPVAVYIPLFFFLFFFYCTCLLTGKFFYYNILFSFFCRRRLVFSSLKDEGKARQGGGRRTALRGQYNARW